MAFPFSAASNAGGPIRATGIGLSPANLAVTVGAHASMTATVSPQNVADATVTWGTADATIATVSRSGVVRGVAAGSTTISATDSAGQVATATVTVSAGYLSYNFESDTLSAVPAGITRLFGSVTANTMEVVAPSPIGNFAQVTGQVVHAVATGTNNQASLYNLTLWGVPSSANQVLTFRAWTLSSSQILTASFGLRMQAATLGTSGVNQFKHKGYWFTVTQGGNANRVLSIYFDSTKLSTSSNIPISNTYFRAQALGTALAFSYSSDGITWTQATSVTDATYTTTAAAPQFDDESWDTGSLYWDGALLTSGVPSMTPVTAFDITASSDLGVAGTQSAVAYTVTPGSATDQSVTWMSSDPTIAYVDPNGSLHRVSPGVVVITGLAANNCRDQMTVFVSDSGGTVPKMKIGVNFWNPEWQPSNTYFVSSVTTAQFAAATYDSGTQLMSLNPWRPELLTDMSVVTGPIRFMDVNNVNSTAVVNWADRKPPTDNQVMGHPRTVELSTTAPAILPEASSPLAKAFWGSATTTNVDGIAYEWLIDLCNRTGRDMWVCVPPFASDDYITQMATLINSRLKTGLTCWVEFANEYWNGSISVLNAYSLEPTVSGSLPGTNKYYQGLAYCTTRSIKAWSLFTNVFGAANAGYGKRLVRVWAGSGNSDLYTQAITNILKSATYNPSSILPDAVACAPYIGPGDNVNGGTLDGAASDIATKYHANIVDSMNNYIPAWKAIATSLGVPLVTYEGGNQLSTNAGTWNANSAIEAEYTFQITQLATSGVKVFNHYTWTGAYSSGSAWGLRAATGDSDTISPKWTAVRKWTTGN